MDIQNRKENIIKIYMLGRFAFEYNDKIVLEDTGNIHKVWELLGYLVANRNKAMTQEELIHLLCGDDRSREPSKAVKNLVYRARKLLAGSGLPEDNYIIQKFGVYRWNNDIPVQVDIEAFEEVYEKAVNAESEDDAVKYCYDIVDMYCGKFVPCSKKGTWADGHSEYYQEMFRESVICILEIIQDRQNWSEIVKISRKAIKFESSNEDIYKIYINALIQLGMHKEALSAYDDITNKIYNFLGTNPSNALRELYREIKKTLKNVEQDIRVIKSELEEHERIDGCYFCQYEIFKDIYRFVARQGRRSGEPMYIMLCTLTDNKNETPEVKELSNAMDWLRTCIDRTLRKGDAFARYSSSQYVLLLPSVNYDNGRKIANRVKNAYKKSRVSSRVIVHYKLYPVENKNNVPVIEE